MGHKRKHCKQNRDRELEKKIFDICHKVCHDMVPALMEQHMHKHMHEMMERMMCELKKDLMEEMHGMWDHWYMRLYDMMHALIHEHMGGDECMGDCPKHTDDEDDCSCDSDGGYTNTDGDCETRYF